MRYDRIPTHPHYVRTRGGKEIGITEQEYSNIVRNISTSKVIILGTQVISISNDFMGIYDKPEQDQNWKGVLYNGKEIIKS